MAPNILLAPPTQVNFVYTFAYIRPFYLHRCIVYTHLRTQVNFMNIFTYTNHFTFTYLPAQLRIYLHRWIVFTHVPTQDFLLHTFTHTGQFYPGMGSDSGAVASEQANVHNVALGPRCVCVCVCVCVCSDL